ncbi:brachyurin-like isoform X1 [Schistocerca gregaria]|uniref:brachyurin-like isoform X1 n=1 Tax=Schistocerca gregaria TaxID=7010 RepID=UPI00211DBD1B|nr:brachyurin-like isoform X1 [Schistocerca gregaria]
MLGDKMKVLAVFLFAVAVGVQALPQNATPLRKIVPMEKTMPLVSGHPEAEDAGGRIIGGSSASLGQFPHQASIIMDDSYLCGGSLISTSAVLTAGHCVSGFSTWEVGLGGLRYQGSESGKVILVTRSATAHSGYDSQTLINDVAVVFLGTNVQLGSNIALVNLPSRSQAGNSFEGQSVTVSGWGLTADNGNNPDTLQYTTLNVISNSACAQYYGSSIISSTLCATGPNRESTCSGDSGGPMVIGSTGSYTLIGVVSFVSVAGCESGAPSGYARVTSFLDWISSTAGVSIS